MTRTVAFTFRARHHAGMQTRTMMERMLLAIGVAVAMLAPFFEGGWTVALAIGLLVLTLGLVHKAPPPMRRGGARSR